MKFVLKSNTDIPVCGFKFHFPSQTGMSVLPPFRAGSSYMVTQSNLTGFTETHFNAYSFSDK
jgi:hypothetical protein